MALLFIRLNFRLAVFFVAILAVVTPPHAASAQTKTDAVLIETQKKLDEAAAERDRLRSTAAKLDRELQKIRRETIAAARNAMARELEISRIEARLKELRALARQKKAALGEDEGSLRRALGALVRMTRNPPGAMLFQDRAPGDTVRGAILLRATVPAIEGRVTQVRSDLNELVRARTEMTQRHADLGRAVAALNQNRVRLDELMAQKTTLRATTEKDHRAAQARVRKLAREAKDLRDLVARLSREPKRKTRAPAPAPQRPPQPAPQATPPAGGSAAALTPAAPRRFSEARGRVPYPVAGRLIGGYGEKLESGLSRKGLSLEARFGAQVIAPFEGSIVFAGPFRGYGHLLIIEHGEGYHTLLAGLSRIDVTLGQTVLAGEPIGVMAPKQANGDQRPLLYVELRRNSQPIDPKPWLQARKENASG